MTNRPAQKMKAVFWVAHHLEDALIVDRYVDLAIRELESRGHKAVVCRDTNSVISEIQDADIMIGYRILPAMFARAKKLKWIQFGSAGIDHTIFPELLESDIIITTMSGIHRTAVSEHVLGLMLALSRRIHTAIRNQEQHVYDRAVIAPFADNLSDKTAGIVGLGKIGTELARLCKSLGMKVIGTKRTIEGQLDYVDQVLPPTALDIVLKQADYVVLIVPLTADTQALIGERELKLMKPSAYIVNVARGRMIDEQALIQALREGWIAGAALDVFTQEPIPHDNPLWDLPNLIITPHVAGSFSGYSERAFEVFRENLNAFEEGQPMINVFNRQRGY